MKEAKTSLHVHVLKLNNKLNYIFTLAHLCLIMLIVTTLIFKYLVISILQRGKR